VESSDGELLPKNKITKKIITINNNGQVVESSDGELLPKKKITKKK